MSLTDRSTAADENTSSSQPSRKMTGRALSIACKAPSENRPSGKIPKAMASSMLRWPMMKSIAACLGTPRLIASSVASRRVSANVAPTVDDLCLPKIFDARDRSCRRVRRHIGSDSRVDLDAACRTIAAREDLASEVKIYSLRLSSVCG